MNQILTAYLYGLYRLRGGRLSAPEAMNHVLDLLSGAQRAKSGFGRLLRLGHLGRGDRGPRSTPAAKGAHHG